MAAPLTSWSLWVGFAFMWHGLAVHSTTITDVGSRKEVVCGNTDVRNMVSNFALRLQNCTVIEGYLQILLIEHADPEAYEKLSFPNLVEITDYLLLYRVYGLSTLARMFPNLSVIRGQKLFFNYALVVFEMPNFESLGLSSLTQIVRGAVRIEKNSKLCYVNTIDWERITDVSEEDHFILVNQDSSACVNLCPKHSSGNGRDICPIKRNLLPGGGIDQQALCWDIDHCQKVCPEDKCSNKACYDHMGSGGVNKTSCCHEECIGGCTGPLLTQCFSCLNVLYDGQCRRRCPQGTYKYLNRRCLTAEQCQAMGESKHFWKVLPDTGMCSEDCPSGYTEETGNNHRCIKCDGPCPKKCGSISINNVASAQKLRGCTIIDGVLEIQIRGGNHVGRELEASLGQVEEVSQHVAIKRTYDISSLSFLRSLRVIGGEALYRERYALVVFDNQNLQEIWDWETHPNLTIRQGHVFFHYNRKLCQHKIQDLVRHVGLENETDTKDVAVDTNGDKITCETVPITLEVVQALDTLAIVKWENFRTADSREILSWVINFREVEAENITIFSARDSCTPDVWKTNDVRPDSDKNSSHVAYFLHNLKPYTKYAMYVQTYTIATAISGAISPIVYFTTKPDVPTPPRDIFIRATSPTELVVTWKEPSAPNGNVTHYYVYWQPQVIRAEMFDRRDYCIDKLQFVESPKTDDIDKENNHTLENCCQCPKSSKEIRIEEDERAFQIEFENFLHDSVYVKRPVSGKPSPSPTTSDEQLPGSRRKRQLRHSGSSPSSPAPPRNPIHPTTGGLEINNIGKGYYDSLLNYSKMYDLNKTVGVEEEEENPYEAAEVYFKKEIVLTNLKHFYEYNIEVIACHDYEENRDQKHCSNRAITVARTQPSMTADTIPPDNITTSNVTGQQRAFISWQDPPYPNGLVLTYEIELTKEDVTDVSPRIRCIPHKKFRENGGYQTMKLEPGSWSFRLRATSLAGNGSWTPTMLFFIPNHDVGPTDIKVIVGISVAVSIVILAAIGCGTYVVIKKKYDGRVPNDVIFASVNPEYWSNVYVPDEWEVPRDKIHLLSELGQGSFGMVYEGSAKNLIDKQAEVKVAVKTVNENASIRDRIEFLNEASVMKAFNCNHVVKLLGVVSKGQPSLVIMELMANGDLKTFLRKRRPDEEGNEGKEPPPLKQILQMASEIADGMAYLAAKKFVHRDLAARNCMVNEDMVVKIGDFGMTRDIYETDYYRKGGKGLLPVRWMAPESLKDGIFDSKSDVWSYGVVMWEMATLAAQPYQGLANEQVLQYVIDGGIMEKPEGCPDKLYELMQLCWRHLPKKRPTFGSIIELLEEDVHERFVHVSYYFSEENRENRYGSTSLLATGASTSDDLEDSADVCTPLRTGEVAAHRGSSLHRQQPGSRARARHDSAGDEVDVDLNSLDDDDDISSSCHSSEVTPSPHKCSHLSQCECVDINKYNAPAAPPVKLRAPSSGLVGLVNGDGAGGGGENRAARWPGSGGRSEWSPTDSVVSGASAIHLQGNEGSKGSSKSSGSSHSGHLNGGVLNGHITRGYIQPPKC